MELPPVERVRLDHQETLAVLPDEPPPLQRNKVKATAEQLRTARVVRQIDLVVAGAHWKLILHGDGEASDTLAVNRLSLHRLLGAMLGLATAADWRLGGIPEWLSVPAV